MTCVVYQLGLKYIPHHTTTPDKQKVQSQILTLVKKMISTPYFYAPITQKYICTIVVLLHLHCVFKSLIYVSDDLLSSLEHYELTIPILVDQSRSFISYDVTHMYHTRRKRSTDQFQSAFTDQWIFYQLSAFGMNFHLNLTLNRKLLSPSYVVEYWNSSGTDIRHHDITDCHYIGHISSHEKSTVAVSNCNGLVSMARYLYRDRYNNGLISMARYLYRDRYNNGLVSMARYLDTKIQTLT